MIALLFLFLCLGVFSVVMILRGLHQAARERRSWFDEYQARKQQHGITITTVEVPNDGGVIAWRPRGDKCRLDQCPPGPFLFKGEISIKENASQPVLMGLDGETFAQWAGTESFVVQPITMEAVDPEPLWIEEP